MENQITSQTMRAFIEGLDGAAVLDSGGAYTYVSPGWERYFGLDAAKVLGKKVWDIVPDTHAREVYQTKQPLYAQMVRSRGTPAFTSYFPWLDSDGSIQAVFLYIVFQGMEYANDLSRRISELSTALNFYKEELSRERGARYQLDNIVGKSSAIQHLKDQILLAAHTKSTVLIEGETGCGKELIAHSIHAASNRCSSNFVRVNCSAIPAELIESEFFGYMSGAFTGAAKGGKIGRFQLADGGSIFLDEVNLLPPTMQPKFLRVLQEKEIDPVGGDKPIPVDTRIIAASNIPLETLVERGDFRQDLYYRLNVITIHAPTLRERMEDIPLLVEHFIHGFNRELGMAVQGIEPSALELLTEYDWPGNVRELQNAVERAMNMASASMLMRKDFVQMEGRIRQRNLKVLSRNSGYHLKSAKRALEQELVRGALAAAGGSKTEAAKLLGISRPILYDKMELYRLK